MNITEVIAAIEEQNEDAVIFAKMENGKFTNTSETVILDLTEAEMEMYTDEIAQKYCPGFIYFLEVFIVKEMVVDLRKVEEYSTLTKLVDRIIYYAEFDA